MTGASKWKHFHSFILIKEFFVGAEHICGVKLGPGKILYEFNMPRKEKKKSRVRKNEIKDMLSKSC